MILRLSLLIFGFMALANLGHAACSSPSGDEGEMVYNGTFKVMQFCNGTDWISMASSYARGIQHWKAESTGALNFATTTWQDVPGATVTFTLDESMDVKGEFDGGVWTKIEGRHCNLGFVLDGVVQGNSVYGDQIVMGSQYNGASDAWWQATSRTRWWSLSAGTYTLKIQGRSGAAGTTADECTLATDAYSKIVLSVTAYPTS